MSRDRSRGRGEARSEANADVLFGFEADRRGKHKDLQLCRQAHEALSAALAAVGEDVLEDVWLVDVVPAPDAGRLMVVIETPPGVDIEEVRETLERRIGFFRSQVAESITRKRTPTLAFRVIPRLEGE